MMESMPEDAADAIWLIVKRLGGSVTFTWRELVDVPAGRVIVVTHGPTDGSVNVSALDEMPDGDHE